MMNKAFILLDPQVDALARAGAGGGGHQNQIVAIGGRLSTSVLSFFCSFDQCIVLDHEEIVEIGSISTEMSCCPYCC
jgi:hypothetical protein